MKKFQEQLNEKTQILQTENKKPEEFLETFEGAAPRQERLQVTGQRPVLCQWQKGDE